VLEALALPFFQRVLLAGLLASVACGVIGAYVVARRVTSLSGGIAHAAFGGVGLGYLVGVPPMLGATAFGLAASLLVGLAERRLQSGLDTAVSMVWSVGMALGIVFVALAPGYAPDLLSYLFGSLLFVPWDYVVWVALLDVVILAAVARFHRLFEAVCFDEEYAEATGVPAERVFLGLLALAALAIVTLIRVVGVILAIALFTIPAATARRFADGLAPMMAIAVALSALCTTGGLFLSFGLSEAFGWSLAPGPLIVLLAAALYGLAALVPRSPAGAAPAASEAA